MLTLLTFKTETVALKLTIHTDKQTHTQTHTHTPRPHTHNIEHLPQGPHGLALLQSLFCGHIYDSGSAG